MDVKITNAELLNLYGALTQVSINGSAKFTYVLAKNRAILKPYVDAFQEASQSYAKSQPGVGEYQKRIDELLKQFAVDENGKPVTRSSGTDGSSIQYVVPLAKHADYLVARELLDTEYNDVIIGMNAHNASVGTLLKEEVEVKDMRALPITEIPSEGMNTQIMNLIFIFVDDEKPAGKVIPLPKKESEK